MKIPEKQEILTLIVNDLSRSGAGVARDENGRVIFIPYSAPGDRVRVQLTKADKRYAEAEILEVLEPSPQRVTPPCSVFGKCGGCQWQHLPYDLQWKTKVGGVKQALQRAGVTLPEVLEEFPAERVWEYRNRIQLRGEGKQIGFYAHRSRQLVSVDRCEIARPELNEAWSETARMSAEQQSERYKVEVEVLASGEIRRTWNAAHGAAGFRQVHDDQNEKLRQWISKTLTPGRELLDLYGGSGNLSIPVAPQMASVHSVDVSAPLEMLEGAPKNLRFHRLDVLPWMLRESGERPKFLKNKPPNGVRSAVLDPPRAGLDKDFDGIATSLESLRVTELIAVGCDPDSWIRDVTRFINRGWQFERAAILDFFPQTPHVESVAFLRYP